MKQLILFLLFSLSITLTLEAQYHLSSIITNNRNESLKDVIIMLSLNDSLVNIKSTDKKGLCEWSNLKSGIYTVTLSHPEFQTIQETFELNSSLQKKWLLTSEKHVELDEVTVTADKSKIVTTKADRTVFYLSKHAREENNPYNSLQEIPKLIVNETNRTITLTNGKSPLILINGNRINKGMDSVDPKEVESIEIIEFPSARYLKEGIGAIVNIKTKQKTSVYHSFNMYSRHMVPLLFGVSGAYYELGGPKGSLSINGQHFYFLNDDTESQRWQKNTGYFKQWNETRKYNSNNFYLDASADWICSPKDYISAKITYIDNPDKTSSYGEGLFEETDGRQQNFTLNSHYKNSYYINTYNLYHKHTFAEEQLFETTLRFNTNGNAKKGMQTDFFPGQVYQNEYDYSNHRYSGEWDMNYSFTWKKQSFDINNNIHFLDDRIEEQAGGNPVFRHKEWNEYFNIGASGSLSPKLMYALSAGLDVIFKQSSDVKHNYQRPVVHTSLTYRLNEIHSLVASYALTNQTPAVGQLNPYNTSTDSLKRICGNPYLLPARQQIWNLQYVYNKNGIYIEPTLCYTNISNLSTITGFTDEKTHIYTQTYQNNSRFQQLDSRLNVRYNNSKWGGVQAGINHITTFYEHQKSKNMFSYSLNFYGWYKKLSWNGYWNYMPVGYGVNSKTKSYGSESELTLSYKLTSRFSLSTGMRYCTGMLRVRNYVDQDTYASYDYSRMTDRRFKIMAGFTYYMQGKNFKYRNKKQLNSNETGISL